MFTSKTSLIDRNGNSIIATSYFRTSSTNECTYINISLQLKNENWTRTLGKVYPGDKVFKIKRSRTKHLFKRTNSYGFNEYVISNGYHFDKILLQDEYQKWLIPKSFIIEKGDYLFFKEQGFEKQLFICLEQLNQFLL